MKLIDVLPLEKWEELEKEINRRFSMNAAVFDKDGNRVTNYKKWVNSLCPVVKGDTHGQRYICAVAHQNIAGEAARTRQPVVGECDAGLVKIAVPIFVGDEFLGVAGGCGRIIDGNKVEVFLVNKVTGIDQEKLRRLSEDVSTITTEDSEKIVQFIKQRLAELLRE